MIIVRLIGGLGNQLFQYAAGRALAQRHSAELKLDVSYFQDPGAGIVPRAYSLDIFGIAPEFATRPETDRLQRRLQNRYLDAIANRVIGRKHSYLVECNDGYDERYAKLTGDVLLQGYWQSPKYFSLITDLLRQDLQFANPPGPGVSQWMHQIAETNSVCLHVRRGDFLTNTNHGFVGLDYYRNAAEIIREKVTDPVFFVFSDDLDWCREHLGGIGEVRYVDASLAGFKDQDHLRMMAACKHFVIPNSSYSWWAVWLSGSNGKIVIAPRNWLRSAAATLELVQPGWITLETESFPK